MDTKKTPAKTSIQIESNDAVQTRVEQKVESVVNEALGITVETFVGVQSDVNWAEKGQ